MVNKLLKCRVFGCCAVQKDHMFQTDTADAEAWYLVPRTKESPCQVRSERISVNR